MENSTPNTLPAEVVECINNWIVTFALAYHRRKDKDISNDAAEFITDELNMPNALTAYATKLNEDYDKLREEFTLRMKDIADPEAEVEELRQWKMKAAEELTIVGAYAHRHLEVNASDSIATLVMEHLNEARARLEEFISMHETGLLPNRFTYEKAKKFINGE
jgi:hypothetical protein